MPDGNPASHDAPDHDGGAAAAPPETGEIVDGASPPLDRQPSAEDGTIEFFGLAQRDGIAQRDGQNGASVVNNNTQFNTLLQHFDPGSVPIAELDYLYHSSPELADRVMCMVERADEDRRKVLNYNIGAAERAQSHDYRLDWFIAPSAWLFAILLVAGGMWLIDNGHEVQGAILWASDFLYVATMRRRTSHDESRAHRQAAADEEAEESAARGE